MGDTPRQNLNGHVLADPHVGTLLFRLSLPAFIGMVVQALYNVVDAIFVGRGVGKLALAAISVAMPIHLTLLAVGVLVGIGSSSIISRALGANDIPRAERALGNAMFTVLVLSGLFAVVGSLYLEPIMRLFGATESILPQSMAYGRIILLGSVVFTFAIASNNIIRSEGRAKFAMITMLISAGLNIILDPIFIFGFHMGVRGAAWATVIAQTAMALWVLRFFLRKHSVLHLRLSNLRPDRRIMAEMLAIGSSGVIRQLGGILLFVTLNRTLRSLGGAMSLAAFGLVHRIMMFIFMSVFGVAQGLQPVAGFNFGARRYHLTQRAAKLAALAAVSLTTIGFIVVQLLAHQLIGIFTTDPELRRQAAYALRMMSLMLPVAGFQVLGASLFQAIGKPVKSLVLTLSRQVLFLLPLVFVFARMFQLDGIWLAFPVSDALTALITGIFFFRQMRQFDRMTQAQEVAS
ncbi:MAG: MATE family efflux transporter [Candidatus Cloacimonetes bacterium]|nr:MATE family efflux transporter [Candidatus Cloacimonadota bacterium]